jgi:hypothetical protein
VEVFDFLKDDNEHAEKVLEKDAVANKRMAEILGAITVAAFRLKSFL